MAQGSQIPANYEHIIVAVEPSTLNTWLSECANGNELQRYIRRNHSNSIQHLRKLTMEHGANRVIQYGRTTDPGLPAYAAIARREAAILAQYLEGGEHFGHRSIGDETKFMTNTYIAVTSGPDRILDVQQYISPARMVVHLINATNESLRALDAPMRQDMVKMARLERRIRYLDREIAAFSDPSDSRGIRAQMVKECSEKKQELHKLTSKRDATIASQGESVQQQRRQLHNLRRRLFQIDADDLVDNTIGRQTVAPLLRNFMQITQKPTIPEARGRFANIRMGLAKAWRCLASYSPFNSQDKLHRVVAEQAQKLNTTLDASVVHRIEKTRTPHPRAVTPLLHTASTLDGLQRQQTGSHGAAAG